MDIATVLGLVGALGLIGMAMMMSASLGAYIDAPSILIVFGGTLATVLARSTLAEFIGSFGTLLKAVLPKPHKNEIVIERLGELAALARKDGMMALEGQEAPDRFFEKGLQLLVDGADEAKLIALLKKEIQAMEARHARQMNVWQAWIDVGPAMGMIGTLIGLVAMLGNMEDPKAIGPAMAIALLTTLYGAIIANVIGLPIVAKLKTYSAAEMEYRRIVLDGLRFIARGDSPRNLQDDLVSLLPPKVQQKLQPA